MAKIDDDLDKTAAELLREARIEMNISWAAISVAIITLIGVIFYAYKSHFLDWLPSLIWL